MLNEIIWEIKLPSFSDSSSQEIVETINSILSSDFKELDVWLDEQIEKKTLKGFKKEKVPNVNFNERNVISILDLKFNERYFKTLNLMKYNEKTFWWDEVEFNNQIFIREFRYTLKIPLDGNFKGLNKENFKIHVPEPWFVDINKFNVKQLKTQKNVTISFIIGFKFDKEITNDELYPNVKCGHEFRLFYNGNWNWHLIWECEKCGFICFCSCFKEAIEGCKQGKIITENKFKNLEGKEIISKTTQRLFIIEKMLLKERGFTLDDLNLNLYNLPYYDNACEVCRGKTSSHRFCHKMYSRSEFERKYGAYAKKKFFEYKLLNEDVNDEDLERRTNNITREELGFRKIGERFVTETELYRIIKSIFPDNKVIHHYKTKWLGKQEIDIFVPHLNLAIEYDGIQHFKPIKAWGGEEGLKKNIERDKIKEEKCKENNVTLIRFTYKENDLLSEDYVKFKLKENGIHV